MCDSYVTICTEQECNKVCGPPGRRGRDASEPSLGSDVRRPIRPRPAADLNLCLGCPQLLVLSEPPGRLSLCAPLPGAQLEVWEDAGNQTDGDEGKHWAAVILAEVCWTPAGPSRRGGTRVSLQGQDQTGHHTTSYKWHLLNITELFSQLCCADQRKGRQRF